MDTMQVQRAVLHLAITPITPRVNRLSFTRSTFVQSPVRSIFQRIK